MVIKKITTLFIDVGGVLLTNGWDRVSRRKAAEHFGLDYEEMEGRHHLAFDTYEVGKITLEDYIGKVAFNGPRSFSHEDFMEFMFAQSEPYQEMIEIIRSLKKEHRLKTLVVSNEGRELTNYRIKKFELNSFIDFFIVSGFVRLRKPDVDIFQLALDVAHVSPEEVAYVEDRPLFVEVARSLGIHAIHHTQPHLTLKAIQDLI